MTKCLKCLKFEVPKVEVAFGGSIFIAHIIANAYAILLCRILA